MWSKTVFQKTVFQHLLYCELLPRQFLINFSQQSLHLTSSFLIPSSGFAQSFMSAFQPLHIRIKLTISQHKHVPLSYGSFRFWCKDKKGALKNPKPSLLVFSIPCYQLGEELGSFLMKLSYKFLMAFLEVTIAFKKENIPYLSVRDIYPSPSNALSKLSGCNHLNLRSETNGILSFCLQYDLC